MARSGRVAGFAAFEMGDERWRAGEGLLPFARLWIHPILFSHLCGAIYHP